MSPSGAVPAADIIDVVIPVFRGVEQSLACIDSVLAAAVRTSCRVVVVEDASPEPGLVDALRALAQAGRIDLLCNAENLGFVASVNRGMALHPDRDAVILNSDTLVAGDWLDRLVACAARDPTIATATPFSNNASICSYPHATLGTDLPQGWSLAELDSLFARENAGRACELPTGVGFCMYIRRVCWTQLGGLDVERFGRGYGEENDFCLRARAAGWKNVLCADVFVFHEGSVSFGQDRFARMREAEAVMQLLHPDYGALVQRFQRADPLCPMRLAVSRARARRSHADALQVVDEFSRDAELRDELLLHWLDGAETHVEALREAHDVLAGQLDAARARAAELDEALARAGNFVREREADIEQLNAALAQAAVARENLEQELAALRAERDRTLPVRVGRWVRRIIGGKRSE